MIWVSGAIGVGGSLDKVLELSSANGSAADPGLDYCIRVLAKLAYSVSGR